MSNLESLSDDEFVARVLELAGPTAREGLLVALRAEDGQSPAEIAASSGLDADEVEDWLDALGVGAQTRAGDPDVNAPPWDGPDDALDPVEDAVRSLAAADTTDGIAAVLASTADSCGGTAAVVAYLYDGVRDEFVPELVTSAAEGRIDAEPVSEGEEPWWSAFRGDRPPSVGEADLVVPVAPLGAVRLVDADRDAGEHGLRTFRPVAAAAIGVLDRHRRIRRLEADRDELASENERLEEFASIVAHDLRNPLSVARGHLDLAVETGDEEHFEAVEEAHDRIDRIVEHTLSLAREGHEADDAETVDLESAARRAWGTVETPDARLRVADSAAIEADPDQLRQLLENLFRNAIEHGATERADDPSAPSVTVTVGTTGDGGFFVADDGPGVPESERSRIFERGYTDQEDGTGFGLHIVREIADAHHWDVRVTDGEDGGARFEITGL